MLLSLVVSLLVLLVEKQCAKYFHPLEKHIRVVGARAWRLSEAADQDDIAVDYAARQGELFTIAGPCEIDDPLVF